MLRPLRMLTTRPHVLATRAARAALVASLLVGVGAWALANVGPSADAATADCTPSANWGTVRTDYADQVVVLVNQHRATLGLVPLKTSAALRDSSVWKARHMAAYGYMTHDDPAPPLARAWYQRVQTCGYSRGSYGENIAYGYPSPQSVMNGWLNSPPHRANIENASYRVLGVGAAASASGTLYWSQNFGSYDDSGIVPTATASPAPTSTVTATPTKTATPTGTATVIATATATKTPTVVPTASPTTTPTPTPSGTAVYPSSVQLFAGSIISGNATSLRVLDGTSFVTSASGGTSWYAMTSGVPNTITALSVNYGGSHSASCTQGVWAWNWTRGTWQRLDSRPAGPSSQLTATVPGTLSEFVSGASGVGNVAIAVTCSRSDGGPVTTNADLMRLTYVQ